MQELSDEKINSMLQTIIDLFPFLSRTEII